MGHGTQADPPTDGSGPLVGIRLLTMALRVPGPVAAQRLRLLGARIVKIEPPAGDHLATQAPEWYRGLHESQEIVHLDLRNDADIAKLHGLLEESDLLLTSQRARVLERLGLAWPALHMRHPRICAVEITGHPAPRQNVPGHDLTYLAEANLLDPPRMPRTLLADLAGAERAVQAALALILERQRFGRVGHREIPLSTVAEDFAAPLRHGLTLAAGPLGGGAPGYRIYRARTGWVALGAVEEHFQARLRELLGLASLDRTELERIFLARSADEWAAWARAHDLPLAAVATSAGASTHAEREHLDDGGDLI